MAPRKICLSLATALIGFSLCACDSQQEREAKYIKRGNELFEKGDYTKARLEYKNAARISPTDAEVRYRLGMVDEAENNLQNAFKNFIAAEQQNAHFHPALLKLAQYLLAAEQYDESQKRIGVVLADAPNDPEAHALNAALLLRKKNFDETEKEARIALEKDATNVTAFSVLTGLYSAKNEGVKALETVEEGIARNPESLPLMLLRAMLYEQASNMEKVIEAYQPIIKLKPTEVRFRADLASIYLKLGKVDEAEAILRAGVADMPENWEMKKRLVAFLGENRGMDVAEKEIRDAMANNTSDDLYFWLADLYTEHHAVDRAVALLEQIVAKDQFDHSGLNARASLARLQFVKGNKELADKLIKVVLEKAPDNQEALFIKARMSVDEGYYQEAVSDLRTIIRDNPKAKNAYQLLAEVLLLQGHLNLAIDTLSQLIDIDPGNTPARVRLAQMYGLNDDTKRALDLLNIVTKSNPNYNVGWESTARIAISAKNWLVADAAVKVLAELEGQQLTASFLKGQILDENGKDEEAIRLYTTVIDADPSATLSEHALSALVDAYHKLGKLESAVIYMRGLKTESPFVATLIGECLVKLNKTEEAAPIFDKVIAGKASFQEPYIGRAKIYMDEKKIDEALAVLKEAIKVAPGNTNASMMAADIFGATGRHKDAISIYEEVLAHNPNADAAANNLAQLIADYQSDDSAAMEKARQYAERFANSDNPFLLDTIGWVYLRQGNLQRAQTIMERVIKMSDKLSPQVHYHYGALLFKLGRTEEAKTELKQATIEGIVYSGREEAKRLLEELMNKK